MKKETTTNDLVRAGKNVILSRIEGLTSYKGATYEEEEERLDYLEQAEVALEKVSQEDNSGSCVVAFLTGLVIGMYAMLTIFMLTMGMGQ